ncbi:hypothetical protein GJ496_008151 [Pomphorhynchus laevis]|nr:hypothetical protein GJ496_008151 [Pomphorhynchus laevis]
MIHLPSFDEFAIAVNELQEYEQQYDNQYTSNSNANVQSTVCLANDINVMYRDDIENFIGDEHNLSLLDYQLNPIQTIEKKTKFTCIAPKISNSFRNDSNFQYDSSAFNGVLNDEQTKKHQRLIRNRESAFQSRQRKKNYLKSLEESVTQLMNENQRLKEENKQYRLLLSQIFPDQFASLDCIDISSDIEFNVNYNSEVSKTRYQSGQLLKRKATAITMLAFCSIFIFTDLLHFCIPRQSQSTVDIRENRVLNYEVFTKELTPVYTKEIDRYSAISTHLLLS